jgi:uncharacterized protein YjbI with pentapeptide repeats
LDISNLRAANLGKTDLRGATFVEAGLMLANLSGANTEGTNFKGAVGFEALGLGKP